jgi:predicted Zn-dependent protease with MMP-like domain/Flp pilus assembly protein TadD
MSRIDRLISLCDRGMELLEEGDLDGAEKQLENARRIDPKHAEVVRLDAAVATADGDADRALTLFAQLAELDVEDATPWLSAAHILLYSEDRPADALVKIDRALELLDDDEALLDAVLIRADILIALDRKGEARETLAELASNAIDDPGAALAIGEAHLAAEDATGALRWFGRATGDPEVGTDALHLSGCAHEALDQKAEQLALWRQVRVRDAAAPWPEWHLEHDEFEKIAAAALAELPARAKELLKDVPVLIDDLPAEGLVDDGFDPRALGLIDGPNLVEQSVEGRGARPVNIFLFQKNLEHTFSDPEDLAEQIRITVLHETAHYFGLDEEQVAALGLE